MTGSAGGTLRGAASGQAGQPGDEDHEWSAQLMALVRASLVAASRSPTPAAVAEALADQRIVADEATVLRMAGRLRAELLGGGPLEDLLALPGLTDLLVNGPGDVWFDCGDGLQRADLHLGSEAAVRQLAQRLAAQGGRRLDEGQPYVDARLVTGARLHAVIPPLAPTGTLISIRLPPARTFALADLVALGSVPPDARAWLELVVRCRLGFLVTGGTGTGKTTVLSSLLSLAGASERLVLVEDSAELAPAHPHVVRLQARHRNVEGSGEVTLAQMVRQSLRMRPDRIVVGEVRGAEVVDLLTAMNTGHEGCAGTVHASSPADVPARLEALGAAAGLPRAAVHSLMAAGLDVVIHLARSSTGQRRVAQVGVLRPDRDGLVTVVPALVHTAAGQLVGAEGLDLLRALVQAR